MRLWLALPIVVALGGVQGAFAQASEVDDKFDTGNVWRYWCPCQIDTVNAPVTFPFDSVEPDKRFGRVVVNDFALGGNQCLTDKPYFECNGPEGQTAAMSLLAATPETEPDLPEALGPSFFGPPAGVPDFQMLLPTEAGPPIPSVRNPYCHDSVELQAYRSNEEGECIQRQELRLNLQPLAEKPYLYALTIRMPPQREIKDRINSVRWVIAQWKEKRLHPDYNDRENWGPSPYLALRFDDAVLHVTVQDEDCRCIVAAAPHPLRVLKGWDPDGKGGSTLPVVADGDPPKICLSTKAGADRATDCPSPPRLKVKYGAHPLLTSPLGKWTDLEFRVQSGDDAKIVVTQDGETKVEVTGRIGYRHAPGGKTKTKFKIGHYRDYMPFPATMDIDRVTVKPLSDH